ncbi:hypothetical protein Q5425_03205 [Amycolatopsis sp. A133]|uniref:hypothetical protein n=1 Tax=Amycolatopsis sp. A133 TaxID=3064472 RepID=UPI0027E6662A|nr:hypothetical protein [Amycolatopsis sp. A133]MDQ7802722.1 hypothetical protein [Amycolatopsis sp. A133]
MPQRLQQLTQPDVFHRIEQLVDDAFIESVRRTPGNCRQPAPRRGRRVDVDVNRRVRIEDIEVVQDAGGRRVRGRSQAPPTLYSPSSRNTLDPHLLGPLGFLSLDLLLAGKSLGL